MSWEIWRTDQTVCVVCSSQLLATAMPFPVVIARLGLFAIAFAVLIPGDPITKFKRSRFLHRNYLPGIGRDGRQRFE
jgi:hypothetical protein